MLGRILTYFILINFLLMTQCNSQPEKEVENKAMNTQEIRKAVVAGSWYSGDPESLLLRIEEKGNEERCRKGAERWR